MTDREGCIGLNLIPGIGYARFQLLSGYFGGPGKVFGHPAEQYASIRTIGPQLSARLASFDAPTAVSAELDLADRAGIRLVTLFDGGYPAVLKELYDPPLCLYVRGHLPEFPDMAVAVVGTRRMSAYGARMSERIAYDAAALGFTVVSGLAMGVDSVAHRAALNAKGVTVAVLGAGLAHIHPRENIPLARDIVSGGGALVSEFPINMPPSRQNFPRRNRIVAGLCRATVVTEAGLDSGAMITAKLAIENNREVFAVPGNVDNPAAKGCNALIRDGAGLIECFDDAAEAMGMGRRVPVGEEGAELPFDSDLDELSRKVLRLLEEGEMGLDEMQSVLNMETGALLSCLMKLELKMLVELTPEQRYRRMA